MPTWSGILSELQLAQQLHGANTFDVVRRKYLAECSERSKRDTILYASCFTQRGNVSTELLQIGEEDLQGIMEVIHGLDGDGLDLILHSPGGSPLATEAIVKYLRTRYEDVRVIVPQLAMSAATMMACSANVIVMGKHSSLGPIDPQIVVDTSLGRRAVPAQAVLDQFAAAQKDCRDTSKLAAWAPILPQFGPDLLIQCSNWVELSQQLVETWLRAYMFKDAKNATAIAQAVAAWLSSHNEFKAHGRHIGREELKQKGLIVDDLEADQEFQDSVLSVFHATTHTFSSTAAAKIIENQLGKAFVKIGGVPVPGPQQALPNQHGILG